MSTLATHIEKEAGRPLTPQAIFDITAARETTLSRPLMLYISTGFGSVWSAQRKWLLRKSP
jgi:hypothetical protein